MKKLFPFLIGGLVGIIISVFDIPFHKIQFDLYIIVFFVIFLYLNIYIHEIGHTIFGLIAGIPIRAVRIGNGRLIKSFRLLNLDFEITNNFNGGFTYPYNFDIQNLRLRFWLFSAGGVLFQAIAISPLIIIHLFNDHGLNSLYFSNIFIGFYWSNIAMIVLTLIPYNINFNGLKIPNDGMRLLITPFYNKEKLAELIAAGLSNNGYFYFQNRDYINAESCFRKAIEYFPKHPMAIINLSATFCRTGQIDEAIKILEDLKDSSDDNKYDTLIYNNLAWAYILKLDNKSLCKAEKYSSVAYKKAKNFQPVIGTRGVALILDNQLTEGLNLLKKTVKIRNKIDPQVNPPTSYLFISYAYWIQGKKDLALKFINKLNAFKGPLDEDYMILKKFVDIRTINFKK